MGGGSEPIRFPEAGWITGTVDDLAGFCERIALNEHLLDSAVATLEQTVNGVAERLRGSLEPDRADVLKQMAKALHQEDDPQTTRMGIAIIANALLFQTAIAGTRHGDLVVATPKSRDSKDDVLSNWDDILEVDYWPIFATARGVLDPVPDQFAKDVLRRLTAMASELAGYGVTSTGDMAGQMFGRLIADRKFLATFYTRPESAHLLAELAVSRLNPNWSDPEQVRALRVADLACGTGTLLTAAYQRMMARVRRAGAPSGDSDGPAEPIDDKALHQAMIESALVGADIMPAAVHLTATLLAAAYPAVPFSDTGIHLMPYGATGLGTEIGSLELLDDTFTLPLALGSGRRQVSGHGDRLSDSVLDHATADLVIMNPPFTRPTNHEGNAAGVPVPSFAGFNTTDDEQHAMARRLKELTRRILQQGTVAKAGDGKAGLGSNFLDVAHAKVKPGGTIAFVLPFTVVSGDAWSKARELLKVGYGYICVVAIAKAGQDCQSFSADTGMAEALIIATRRHHADDSGGGEVLYVNLAERPSSLVEAVEIARSVNRIAPTRRTGSLEVGEARIGSFIRAALVNGGCAGIVETDLAACGMALGDGRLVLPQLGEIEDVPITRLGELGSRGPYHLDIRGSDGPFDEVKLDQSEDWRAATYPMLWAHNAKREKRLFVEPDSQGRIRQGREAKARDIWATASRLHFNLDFRLNSQPLAACLTPERSIGGRAWPSFAPSEPRWEKVLVLWANSTLGLISFWWTGTRQQQGRANLTVLRLPDLPVLDPRQLSDEQLDTAADIFERFSGEEFLPANEAYRDETRKALDEAVLVDLLAAGGFSVSLRQDVPAALDVLRRQWCAEPSVHGGKKTRPNP